MIFQVLLRGPPLFSIEYAYSDFWYRASVTMTSFVVHLFCVFLESILRDNCLTMSYLGYYILFFIEMIQMKSWNMQIHIRKYFFFHFYVDSYVTCTDNTLPGHKSSSP
jgi:hypothetical protein